MKKQNEKGLTSPNNKSYVSKDALIISKNMDFVKYHFLGDQYGE